MTKENPSIDLNKILGAALAIGVENLSKRTKENIRNQWLKISRQYGFSVTPKEDNRLKEIAQNSTYRVFKECVGRGFIYTKFIKIGLLLHELNVKNEKERVQAIRQEIYNSKQNKYAMKIIHIASTGVLSQVLSYLIDIKEKRALSKYAVREEFKKILQKWNDISISVGNEDKSKEIQEGIIKLVQKRPSIIIVYAAKSACIKAQRIVASLSNSGVFKGKYLLWSKNEEIMKFTQFLGILYSVENDLDTVFSD